MGPEPVLVAQLSDPHVSDDDETRAQGLAAAVRSVGALDPEPAAVLVTGDLAEHGGAREYARVRELLSALSMPVHVLAGNHDDRDVLRERFPLPGADAASQDYRYATACGPLRLVACDTTQRGRDDGRLGPARLAWLDARLAEDRETPTIVAMHHPPLVMGIGAWDDIGLATSDRVALAAVVARHPQVAPDRRRPRPSHRAGHLGRLSGLRLPEHVDPGPAGLRPPGSAVGRGRAAGLRAARRRSRASSSHTCSPSASGKARPRGEGTAHAWAL